MRVVWIIYLHVLGQPAAVDIPSVWEIKSSELACKRELTRLNQGLTHFEYYCEKATVTD